MDITSPARVKPPKRRFQKMWKYRWVYLLLLPGVLYYLLFRLGPLTYLRIIFQKYSPQVELLGRSSPWMEPLLRNFEVFFTNRDFPRLLGNTLALAGLDILICFPFPIILSLMLNELRGMRYKRTVQSVLYLPHFVSWAVLASIMILLLGPTPNGLVNSLLKASGKGVIPFLESEGWFRPMYIIELLWKESGWGTIIYLAALSGVDEQLYEAAVIDGAGRFKQLLYITLPAISTTIVIMLILRLGSFLDTGFEQIYLMTNSLNRSVAQVFDTYVYEVGLCGMYKPVRDVSTYSYAATVGVCKSIVSTLLVVGANALSRVFGEESLF